MRQLKTQKTLKSTLRKVPTDISPPYGDVDIVRLARFHGFIVGESARLPDTCPGILHIYRDDTTKLIIVNTDISNSKKRFLIAYALAYCFVYPGFKGRIALDKYDSAVVCVANKLML